MNDYITLQTAVYGHPQDNAEPPAGTLSICKMDVEGMTNAPDQVMLLQVLPVARDSNATITAEQPEQAATLRETLDHVHPSLRWVLEDVKLPVDEGKHIAEKIRAGEGGCMRDGSLKELFGTSGFTFLADNDVEEHTYVGSNRVPGTDEEQTS